MKVNLGITDRIVRVILALVMILAVILNWVTGVFVIVVGILAVVFLATALIRFCPLYLPFGLRTNKK